MILEREAVIKHIESVADIHMLASDYVDAREENEEAQHRLMEISTENNRLREENYMLHELVKSLSSALCSNGGKG